MSTSLEESLRKEETLACEAREIAHVDQSSFHRTMTTRDYGSDHDWVLVTFGQITVSVYVSERESREFGCRRVYNALNGIKESQISELRL